MLSCSTDFAVKFSTNNKQRQGGEVGAEWETTVLKLFPNEDMCSRERAHRREDDRDGKAIYCYGVGQGF